MIALFNLELQSAETTRTWSQVLATLWDETAAIWDAGGWAMYGIAALSMLMFATGIHLWMRLRERGLDLPEHVWREWVDDPSQRRGVVGELLDFVMRGRSHDEMLSLCDEVRAREQSHFERDLKVMKTCVATAPLIGLLGTVTGMLATFAAMASGSGGDETMDQVTSGIAEALITTETGLVVALPGLFFQFQLTRRYQRYRAFLLHLESVCAQSLHRRSSRQRRETSRHEARLSVAARLRAGLARQPQT